jgi:hypothetical protein
MVFYLIFFQNLGLFQSMVRYNFSLFGWMVLFSLNTWFSLSAWASDFHSPRTEALGGAGHATPLLTDAVYLNPSYHSFMTTHAFSFTYLTYSGGSLDSIPNYHGNNMNLSIIDGSPESLFQAGVGYTRRDDNNFIHIGASKKIIHQLGVGLGLKFIFPNDPSGGTIAESSLSASSIIFDWLQASLLVENLLQSAVTNGFYREFTLGTKINLQSLLLIYIDPSWVPSLPSDQAQWGLEAGLEIPVFKDFFVRAGKFQNASIPYQARRGNGFGVGVGWLGPKISFDYAFSHVTSPIPTATHTVGTSIYF